MDNTLSIVSLVWVIYIFLFTGYDKILSDTFQRLKCAIAIDIDGRFNLKQQQVTEHMGLLEIFEFGKKLNKDLSRAQQIERFRLQYIFINGLKKLLEINLILLTIHGFVWPVSFLSFKIHLIFSLFLIFSFYLSYNTLNSLRFINFTIDKK